MQAATEPALTPNAIEVLQARYLKRDARDQVVETPAEMFWRVATHIAAVEQRYHSHPEEVAKQFYEAMARLEFLPNSPALMNAGTRLGQLAACFVLPIGDSLDSIFSSLRDAALIHQTGGGVGYDFSPVRPKGDRVASTGGASSGPVSFMKAFDASVEAIRQGGRRRGANMGVLDVHHPDVEVFITAKRDDPGLFRNFNLSVAADDAFMEAAARGGDVTLLNPRTGQSAGTRPAKQLLDLIAECACESGDPGLIFVDRINRDNPTPALGRITATNPCGEVPLLPYEACILGSINLAALSVSGSFDWDRLDELADLGIRFLDDCLDASVFPLPQIRAAVHGNRKVGLGVMGFADALVDLRIRYDDEAAVRFAHEIGGRLERRVLQASASLAAARGPYPNFSQSRTRASEAPIRNATRLAIAPTGTLSLIAGCSSGIEPLFAVAYERHVLDGRTLVEINQRFEKAVQHAALGTAEWRAEALESGRVRGITAVPPDVRALFPTAHEISPEQHIRIQAAFQAHVDNAVSKTVNFPSDATAADVVAAYRRAFELGCKGITVYRHGAKTGQVLTPIAARRQCPECPGLLEFAEGGRLCRACGFSSST